MQFGDAEGVYRTASGQRTVLTWEYLNLTLPLVKHKYYPEVVDQDADAVVVVAVVGLCV